jgi:hypothetical protein
MLKTSPSRQRGFNWFSITYALPPLTLGVALLTSAGMPAEAIPVVVQSLPPTTQIYGSPIPSPVPVIPGTSNPYSLSPYDYSDYNSVIRPGRGVIRNSTLINPTVINSRIVDSVLVDPVIINSPRYPLGTFGRSRVIYNSPGYYSPGYYSPGYYSPGYYSPGSLRIRIGY